MTNGEIKDAICELLEDGTLIVRTDMYPKVGRVFVEHNGYGTFFYSDGYEKPRGQWIIDDCEAGKVKRCRCTECGKDPLTFVAATEKIWIYTNQMPKCCPNCGAEMR